MLQLADRIHAEDTLDETDAQHETEMDLAAKTVVKHWGQQQKQRQQISAKSVAMLRQQSNSAADRYHQRNVSGLVLLSLGAGEMCGELALGFSEEASRHTSGPPKPVQESQNSRTTFGKLKPGRLQHSTSLQGTLNAKVRCRELYHGTGGEIRLRQYPRAVLLKVQTPCANRGQVLWLRRWKSQTFIWRLSSQLRTAGFFASAPEIFSGSAIL